MAQAFVPGLQIRDATVVRRERELPIQGEISVKIGDQVKADQIVASASLLGELHILRIAEKMGLEAHEVAARLTVKEGDQISEGKLLCEHSGLFGLLKSRYHSPLSGVVELVSPHTGHVGVRMAPRKLELQAHIAGKVIKINQGKSVTIESRAAFLQGIFGVGGERRGRLSCMTERCDQSISAGVIPRDCGGAVLFGGTSPDLESLRLAAQRGAQGMIVGAIDDRALAGYLGYDLGIALTGDEKVAMTVIISEGFGALPISHRFFELLRKLEGKQASINGATQVRAGAVRPEIIVVDETGASGVETQGGGAQGLYIGAQIRIIRVPYFGLRGVVEELPHISEKIETGAVTRILRARLQDGSLVTVPRANVELVD
ncbi:MAG: hypothetical protein DCC75_04085 [Proteobacteria bacterium]|nr:MAG: hypothetical protein DCC75_04085 [Pseudomonadota bacterium]